MNESIKKGFIKRAQEYGVPSYKAEKLLKEAGGIGTYFNQRALSSQNAVNNMGTAMGFNIPNYIPGLGTAYALAGGPEMATRAATLGGSDKERYQNLDKIDKQIKDKDYTDLALSNAGKGAIPGALIGGALGGSIAGLSGQEPLEVLKETALGGTIGAGAVGSAAGLVGLINKFVSNHTDKKSKESAKRLISEHPYASSLPLGGVIGSAYYG